MELLLQATRPKDDASRLEQARRQGRRLSSCNGYAKRVNPVAPRRAGRGSRAARAKLNSSAAAVRSGIPPERPASASRDARRGLRAPRRRRSRAFPARLRYRTAVRSPAASCSRRIWSSGSRSARRSRVPRRFRVQPSADPRLRRIARPARSARPPCPITACRSADSITPWPARRAAAR
jgi:hypothetical protein